MKIFSTLCLLLILAGCASAPMIHGISNLKDVDQGNIYRSGQPNAEGFIYAQDLGIYYIVKLDLGGDDYYATHLGMEIEYQPISTFAQLGFGSIDRQVMAAVEFMRTHPKHLLVHCEHGQDRTGLVIACYRVRVCHWSKADAEQEMLAHGFHKSLLGLWHYWEEFKP